MKTETVLALVLTATGGYVDAIGYLTLGGIYIANMSGNSVHTGIQISSENIPEMLAKLWPIVSFFAGLLACRVLIELLDRRGVRTRAAVTLAIELALLSLFAALTGFKAAPQPVRVFLAASAMGFQNATIARFGRYKVYTSFVTGTLIKLAGSFGAWLVKWRKKSLLDSVWLFSIWVAYVGGAIAGAYGNTRWGAAALSAPCAAIAVMIAVDLAVPVHIGASV